MFISRYRLKLYGGISTEPCMWLASETKWTDCLWSRNKVSPDEQKRIGGTVRDTKNGRLLIVGVA
jgi:hypothetical protein